MTKLDYGYNPQASDSNGSINQVSNAKTALSKQAIANQVVLNSMPKGGGQLPPMQTQNTGFGRTR